MPTTTPSRLSRCFAKGNVCSKFWGGGRRGGEGMKEGGCLWILFFFSSGFKDNVPALLNSPFDKFIFCSLGGTGGEGGILFPLWARENLAKPLGHEMLFLCVLFCAYLNRK